VEFFPKQGLLSGLKTGFRTLLDLYTSSYRPELHDTGFASERHQILHFQEEFSAQNYDNITELVKKFKYEKL
jgi:hypothetical protein